MGVKIKRCCVLYGNVNGCYRGPIPVYGYCLLVGSFVVPYRRHGWDTVTTAGRRALLRAYIGLVKLPRTSSASRKCLEYHVVRLRPDARIDKYILLGIDIIIALLLVDMFSCCVIYVGQRSSLRITVKLALICT